MLIYYRQACYEESQNISQSASGLRALNMLMLLSEDVSPRDSGLWRTIAGILLIISNHFARQLLGHSADSLQTCSRSVFFLFFFMISDCSSDAAALYQHWNMLLRFCCSSSAAAALYQLLLYLSDMQQLCLCPAVMISDCSTDAAALICFSIETCFWAFAAVVWSAVAALYHCCCAKLTADVSMTAQYLPKS